MRNKFYPFVLIAVFLLFSIFCGGAHKNRNTEKNHLLEVEQKIKENTDEVKPDMGEKVEFRIVNLYFVEPDTGALKVEKRQVFDLEEKTSMIKQVLRSLKLGPVSNLKPSVPQNIEFKDVFIYNGTVYIDLHKTSEDSFIGGVEGEELFIESVVKTILDLSSDYKKVCFLIDGEEVDSLLGHLDCSNFFSKDSF